MLKIVKVLLGLTALFGVSLLSVPAAVAEPASPSAVAVAGDVASDVAVADSGTLGTLPSCADYDHSGQRAWVTNNCSYVVHAKIIWAFASDTACTRLSANGGWLTSERSGLARFDGAVSC
ncbi:hypothetical protein [Saccharothrix xinjiangensis]|uniref:Uncharacterized protein n=1 Tax=Saccharothrix xinjiangensis TaxID=204798 RepID=A0ABV9Y657_9PSEU